MSVLIRGMEMPTNCLSCPLQGGTADCRLTQKTYNWGLTERPSDCPLIPVPEHGRLIDADVLQAKQQEDADLFIDSNSLEDADLFVDSYSLTDKIRRDEALNAVANIVNAPTIIPASEEGE